MKPIIQVQTLGKKYTIRHQQQERYTALRDVMAQKVKKLFSFPARLRPGGNGCSEDYWALKDIDFEIQPGDRVGIIGRNGAGKSTLLKILSRITEPTTGRVELRGRVASLLEVGTGFHPELTGRENIFLNGAILGMSRSEIRSKFDEIVDFSGVEQFLDTPVKRYSSGMYVRLAFAVAAHLEPEILVVDEVLAVGDAEFQKKCLGKMEEFSNSTGRTVLFVSHAMGSINQLCNVGIFLNRGNIIATGTISQAIKSYLDFSKETRNTVYLSNNPEKFGITKIEVLNAQGEVTNELKHNEEILFRININLDRSPKDIYLLIIVQDNFLRKIFSCEKIVDKHEILLAIEKETLTRGSYSLNCIIYTPAVAVFENISQCCEFSIIDSGSQFSHLETFDYGVVFAKHKWL